MLSLPHLIVIFIVALGVFGPEKLPELARQLGKWTAEFRRVTGDLRSSFEDQMRQLEREAAEIEQEKRELAAKQANAAATQSSATLVGAPQEGTRQESASATAAIKSLSSEGRELSDTRATENDVPPVTDAYSPGNSSANGTNESLVAVSASPATRPDCADKTEAVSVQPQTPPDGGKASHGDA